jgi:hypothetical protein
MAALPGWQGGLETLASTLTNVAAGGGIAIPYIFSTTTGISDPGSGKLRANDPTFASSTTNVIFSNTGSNSAGYSTLFSYFVSNNRYQTIRLVKVNDPTKWVICSAVLQTSGSSVYSYNLSTVLAKSSASPFNDGDSIVMMITEKGATGATGPSSGMSLLSSLAPAAGVASVNFSTVFSDAQPANYAAFMILGRDIIASAADSLLFNFYTSGSLDTGSNYYRHAEQSATAVTTASTSGSVTTSAYFAAGRGINFKILVLNPFDTTSALKSVMVDSMFQSSSTGFVKSSTGVSYPVNTALQGISFKWNAASTFLANGAIDVYGLTTGA